MVISLTGLLLNMQRSHNWMYCSLLSVHGWNMLRLTVQSFNTRITFIALVVRLITVIGRSLG